MQHFVNVFKCIIMRYEVLRYQTNISYIFKHTKILLIKMRCTLWNSEVPHGIYDLQTCTTGYRDRVKEKKYIYTFWHWCFYVFQPVFFYVLFFVYSLKHCITGFLFTFGAVTFLSINSTFYWTALTCLECTVWSF